MSAVAELLRLTRDEPGYVWSGVGLEATAPGTLVATHPLVSRDDPANATAAELDRDYVLLAFAYTRNALGGYDVGPLWVGGHGGCAAGGCVRT